MLSLNLVTIMIKLLNNLFSPWVISLTLLSSSYLSTNSIVASSQEKNNTTLNESVEEDNGSGETLLLSVKFKLFACLALALVFTIVVTLFYIKNRITTQRNFNIERKKIRKSLHELRLHIPLNVGGSKREPIADSEEYYSCTTIMFDEKIIEAGGNIDQAIVSYNPNKYYTKSSFSIDPDLKKTLEGYLGFLKLRVPKLNKIIFALCEEIEELDYTNADHYKNSVSNLLKKHKIDLKAEYNSRRDDYEPLERVFYYFYKKQSGLCKNLISTLLSIYEDGYGRESTTNLINKHVSYYYGNKTMIDFYKKEGKKPSKKSADDIVLNRLNAYMKN